MSKYRNKRTRGYASKKEAERANQLGLLQHAGKISNLREQVRFQLIPKCERDDGTIERELSYIADFVYTESGKEVVEDVKGYRTDVFKIKRKLMLYVHGITIKET